MSKRRIYTPSDTHLALHPPRVLIDCPCGVRFAERSPSINDIEDDDPSLCLTCNRARWSRLWNGNRPVTEPETVIHADIETEGDNHFEMVSDSDIGEVVSMVDRKRRL